MRFKCTFANALKRDGYTTGERERRKIRLQQNDALKYVYAFLLVVCCSITECGQLFLGARDAGTDIPHIHHKKNNLISFSHLVPNCACALTLRKLLLSNSAQYFQNKRELNRVFCLILCQESMFCSCYRLQMDEIGLKQISFRGMSKQT